MFAALVHHRIPVQLALGELVLVVELVEVKWQEVAMEVEVVATLLEVEVTEVVADPLLEVGVLVEKSVVGQRPVEELEVVEGQAFPVLHIRVLPFAVESVVGVEELALGVAVMKIHKKESVIETNIEDTWLIVLVNLQEAEEEVVEVEEQLLVVDLAVLPVAGQLVAVEVEVEVFPVPVHHTQVLPFVGELEFEEPRLVLEVEAVLVNKVNKRKVINYTNQQDIS